MIYLPKFILNLVFFDSDSGTDHTFDGVKVEKLIIDYEGDGYDLEILLERRVESERIKRERKELSEMESRDEGEDDGASDRRRIAIFDDNVSITSENYIRKMENKESTTALGNLIAPGLEKAKVDMSGIMIEDSKRRLGNTTDKEDLSEGENKSISNQHSSSCALDINKLFWLCTSVNSAEECLKADQFRTQHDRELNRRTMDPIYATLRSLKEEKSALREACQHTFQIPVNTIF